MIFQYVILFILILVCSSAFRNRALATFLSNVTDQQALLSVKDSISSGDPMGRLSSWNDSINFCHWEGVTCSRRHQRVIALNLSSQQLVGTLSPHIGNLSFLRFIYLDRNEFRGPIPGEIGKLFRLQYLYLGYNFFEGGFPVNLSHCSDARHIHVEVNNLGGELPDFASWSKLTVFNATKNHFTGVIPSSIGNISSLLALDLYQNNLTGSIPWVISHNSKLVNLNLGDNKLSMVPPQLFNISSLSIVDLAGNELEGWIPADLGTTLPNLVLFFAEENKLSGVFPPSITNASNLAGFDLSGSYKITGPLPMNFGSLSRLKFLGAEGINLGHNQQPGGWSFLGSLANCTRLKYLYIGHNGLSGKLPNLIGNLSTRLDTLSCGGNPMYGSIPQEIGKLVNMTHLILDLDMLSGSIPQSICKLSKLGYLSLGGNTISGAIPSCISNITGLYYLDISQNMLYGSIPSALFNISSLHALYLNNHHLSGGISEQMAGLSSQGVIVVLSQNQLTGSLPSNMGSLKLLTLFDVSSNQLTGEIPASLGDCLMLEELHMEGNLFKGGIPSSFKVLKGLAFLDLSNNNMTGEGRYGSVYKGILQSSQQIVAVKVLNADVHGAEKIFLAECETLRTIRHRNLVKIITTCNSIDFKGNKFMALVFEFMENGSLENWLHASPSDEGNGRNLTLFQRLNIAIDVALAVDYIHHRSPSKIIHCDIKPSNILLDEELVAHVSDFGLARFFLTNTGDINHPQTSSTGVRGTVGYVPPEYGMGGKISPEGDVYSYGILLLEMFSGKRPTTSSILMDHTNINLHHFVRNALPRRVMEIVDPRIRLQTEDCASMDVFFASVFEVGVLCSVETPKERIDISVAIKKLHLAREKLVSLSL